MTEQELRENLQSHGFDGRSARFDYVELKAIERPGWVQVFEFRVHVLDEGEEMHHLMGVLRDDERKGMDVFLTESETERDEKLREWSTGLITLRRSTSKFTPLLLVFFAVLLSLAILGAFLSR